MYSLVPADSEAHKHSPKKPFNVPDGMMSDRSSSKTSLRHSGGDVKKNNLRCRSCDKTYKNKKSLADHKRRYHSKLPLRLFSNRKTEKFASESDSDQSDDSKKYGDGISRKRKIPPDTIASRKKHIVYESEDGDSDDDKTSKHSKDSKPIHGSRSLIKRKISSDPNASRKKHIVSESEDGDSDDDKSSKHSKGSKPIHGSRALISHPPRKRSISPDTHKVLKKIKRRHAEESAKRKIRKNLEKRRRNKRKQIRRKLVVPKYVEPRNTDDEVDDVSATEEPEDFDGDNSEDKNVDNKRSIEKTKVTDDDAVEEMKDETDENTDDNSNDDDDTVDTSKYVNCVSIEDFEKVRKAIKNYQADSVISDVNGLHVIKTLFKGILDGWIPICTSQKQMFSKDAINFIRKAKNSKIVDLSSLIINNREELENIFNFVDKSIKLVVESYNKFGITDDTGEPQ